MQTDTGHSSVALTSPHTNTQTVSLVITTSYILQWTQGYSIFAMEVHTQKHTNLSQVQLSLITHWQDINRIIYSWINLPDNLSNRPLILDYNRMNEKDLCRLQKARNTLQLKHDDEFLSLPLISPLWVLQWRYCFADVTAQLTSQTLISSAAVGPASLKLYSSLNESTCDRDELCCSCWFLQNDRHRRQQGGLNINSVSATINSVWAELTFTELFLPLCQHTWDHRDVNTLHCRLDLQNPFFRF